MTAVHPSDRHLIHSWTERVTGRILDAGCGPGHWTNYLTELGLDAYGIDLVAPFVEHARSTYPDSHFAVQSLDSIEAPSGSLGGILSWFSTIHHQPTAIGAPLAEFARTLRPGGHLALGYFDSASTEPFDHAVLRAYRWRAEDLHRLLDAAGFDVTETHRRSVLNQRPVGTILAERRRSGLNDSARHGAGADEAPTPPLALRMVTPVSVDHARKGPVG